MLDKKKFYINGQWVSSLEARTFKVINPANEEPCAEISLGGKKDVDSAVSAARKAYESWSFTSKKERLALLEKFNGDEDKVRKLCHFTTHTPVPAGHDHFSEKRVKKLLYGLIPDNLKLPSLVQNGRLHMTELGLYFSNSANGVSKLHGNVARSQFPWTDIGHITNGVHHSYWMASPLKRMFNKYIKLIIAVLIFSLAIKQFVDGSVGSTGNGIALIFLSLIFILLFFRNEFLILAFFQLRKQNLVGADKWLNRIKNPQTALTTKQQGYFNYLKGLIISQENMNQAEKYFRTAITLGLNMDHDLAMAKLNLAGILFTKRRKIEAQKMLKEAQNLDKNGMLTGQIKMMKNQMKKTNIPNQHFGRNNMRRR